MSASRDFWAKRFFLLFFLAVGLHKTNYLISQLTGFNIQATIGFSLLTLPLLFLLLAEFFSRHSYSLLAAVKRDFLLGMTLMIVHFDLLYGIVVGNSLEVIVQEYWTAMIVLYGYRISSDFNLLNLFRQKELRITFVLFTVATLYSTTLIQEHLTIYDFTTDLTTATLAYEVSPTLDFWPFVFLFALFSEKQPFRKIWVYIPIVVYLGFQLFFVKRAPSVRVLAIVTLAVTAFWYRERRGDFIIRILVGIIFLIGAVALFAPKNLIERFQKEDTSRQTEAISMLKQFDFGEMVIGKGLGGYYLLEEGAGLIEVNDQGDIGKHILHIGLFYPYLKGGILLFTLVLAHVIRSIYIGVRMFKRLHPYQLGALVFIIIYSLFRLIEGPFSPGLVFDGFLFGTSLGLLNQRQNIFS